MGGRHGAASHRGAARRDLGGVLQARGVAALPANMAAAQGLGVIAGLYKDGALIPGSEVMAAFNATGANAPLAQVQATGTRQFVHSFRAG
ncbi:hypothetical protein [Streptomyces sp. NPDC087294]|uniref:hypothetical protein n=1 Tax=Streptomyces sp. NPDC087294 TaxID=3365777 RepID=UPI0038105D5B